MRTPLLLLTAVFTLTAQAQEPKTYPLKIERPAHVGDQYDLSITKRDVMTKKFTKDEDFPDITHGGELPPKIESTQILEGRTEVLAISEKGQPTKFRITVKKFIEQVPGQADYNCADANQVIEAEVARPQDIITINGKDPEGRRGRHTKQALKDLLFDRPFKGSVNLPGRGMLDRFFGTPAQKAPGTEWNADLGFLNGFLGYVDRSSSKVKDGTGKINFEKLATVGDIECSILTGKMTFQSREPQDGPYDDRVFPSIQAKREGSHKLEIALVSPLDQTLTNLESTVTWNVHLEMSLADGQSKASVIIDHQIDWKETRMPLKPTK